MIDQSAEALASAAAISGGQLAAQGPLQVLLPLPAVSLSKVYRVMPLSLTRTPSAVVTGGPPVIDDIWAHEARTNTARTIESRRNMEKSPWGSAKDIN